MPKKETTNRLVASQDQMARDIVSGKFKGDVYIDGKPAPREGSKHKTIALMDRLAQLDKERAHAIK